MTVQRVTGRCAWCLLALPMLTRAARAALYVQHALRQDYDLMTD
jgi:hypothetical protein